MILFLCCQIDQVKVTHQHFHLLHIIPPFIPFPYCRKCCLGFRGNAPEVLTQDRDSHHKGSVLVQLKNKWTASSSLFLQKGHIKSLTSTCLLRKLDLVGNRSLISLQAKIDALAGILSFHRSSSAPSRFSSAVSPPLFLPTANYMHSLWSNGHWGQVSTASCLLYVANLLSVISPPEIR